MKLALRVFPGLKKIAVSVLVVAAVILVDNMPPEGLDANTSRGRRGEPGGWRGFGGVSVLSPLFLLSFGQREPRS